MQLLIRPHRLVRSGHLSHPGNRGSNPLGVKAPPRGFCHGPCALVKGTLVLMPAVLCLSMLLDMAVPPPSLEQVQDDTEFDAAFVELVDYVQSMSHDGAVRVEIDLQPQWLNRHTAGCRLRSPAVLNSIGRGRPFHSVQEWFIRDEAGAPAVCHRL